MNQPPILHTQRLLLRPFQLTDATNVQALAGDWDVAKTTANIPHPYEDGMAEEWITRQREAIERGTLINFAIIRKHDNTLIGAIGLSIRQHEHWGEMGYWVGKPFWSQGYCTEAARALLAHGFARGLNRIQARHMSANPASGQVMRKLDMVYEGAHRQASFRHGVYSDLAMYSLLKYEHDEATRQGFIIRALRLDEWQQWKEMRLRSLADTPDAFGETLAMAAARPDADWVAFAATSSLPDQRAFLAKRGGVPIGMVRVRCAVDAPRQASLYAMWVVPDARGRGVGRALVERAVAWGQEAGAAQITLAVTEGNEPALALYRALGFEDTGASQPLRNGSDLVCRQMVKSIGR